ncbi:hypothetical protein H0H92_006620, partial [Tricholoma furcatifolium]
MTDPFGTPVNLLRLSVLEGSRLDTSGSGLLSCFHFLSPYSPTPGTLSKGLSGGFTTSGVLSSTTALSNSTFLELPKTLGWWCNIFATSTP